MICILTRKRLISGYLEKVKSTGWQSVSRISRYPLFFCPSVPIVSPFFPSYSRGRVGCDHIKRGHGKQLAGLHDITCDNIRRLFLNLKTGKMLPSIFAVRRIGMMPVPRSSILSPFFTTANPKRRAASIPKQKAPFLWMIPY